MIDTTHANRLQITATADQLATIAEFEHAEGLTRPDALRLLLAIALESVTSGGNRFWDRRTSQSPALQGVASRAL